MDKKVTARENSTGTSCVLQEDGTWKVICEIKDRILYEGETEWREEVVNAMSLDSDVKMAIQTAMGSTLNYLMQNVYKNGFDGLIEYRDYLKRLEDSKVEKAEA